MKDVNSVLLEGFLQNCRFVEDNPKSSAVLLSVLTFSPRTGVPETAAPSLRYQRISHNVRMPDAGGELRERLRLLADRNLASGGELPAVSVLGSVVADRDRISVLCPQKGFAFREADGLACKNQAKVTGVVKELSFTDNTASLFVELAGNGGVMRSDFFRDVNQDLMRELRTYDKGDSLFLNGPLIGSYLTDGHMKTLRTVLVPTDMKQVKLSRHKGQSI